MSKLKSVKKKTANEKWVEASMRLNQQMTDTMDRIERILAREKETGK